MNILLVMGAAMLATPGFADVYKYIDGDGNVLFSDQPLDTPGLRLEWKRSDHRLVAENRRESERQRQVAARLTQRLLEPSSLSWDSSTLAPVTGLSAKASLKDRRAFYQGLIRRTAYQHQLWPELLHAVVRTESAYRADAKSSAGACGLMQLMPATAERFKVRHIWDPAENLRGGATYLRLLLDLFHNDLRLALAAYNAGENAVKRHGNEIPPYPETQEYVRKVLRFLHAERHAYNS
jgi:soluble lytic murein transglycosylase-like protein